MKIGLLRETKSPLDSRVVLSPMQCKEVVDKFPFVEIIVQKSPFRCFKDSEYESLGFPVREDISDCQVLLGVRDIPIEDLLHHKTYFFFSRIVKKHPQQRLLLLTLLQRHIRLIDYECLEDTKGNHLVSFGLWNGRVGIYNALLAYGKKTKLFDLPPFHTLASWEKAEELLRQLSLPALKIALIGVGNTAQSVKEVLESIGFKSLTKADFLEESPNQLAYVALSNKDIHYRKDGKPFDKKDFMIHPHLYECTFKPYAQKTDILIVANRSVRNAPVYFSKEDVQQPSFAIKVIADLFVDVDGVVPCVKKPSTLKEPFYDYNPTTDHVEPAFSSGKNLTIMAVENLSDELPKQSSEHFGRKLIDNVFPYLLIEDKEDIIFNATLTIDGKLNKPYLFLQDFVEGK